VAAGDALGVIDLGGGIRAAHVASYPAYDVKTHKFVHVRGKYIYHLTGGRARGLSACPGHANDIYITSSRPLDAQELKIAGDAANGVYAKGTNGATVFKQVPGLKSMSDGCGDAGVEAIVGAPPLRLQDRRLRDWREHHHVRAPAR
jgi:hypothetical protein